jgi:S-adenosylmethionine synthetase
MSTFLFSSESVTEGHPDKLADQISDAVLDAVLAAHQDPASPSSRRAARRARVAVETLVKDSHCVLAGEVRSDHPVDYAAIARRVMLDVGYDDDDKGLDGNNADVRVLLGQQSIDIARGVDRAPVPGADENDGADELGAGDQGLMFGYATDETSTGMPLPIELAHALTRRLAEARRSSLPWLRPDGKAQVTIAYDAQQRPVGVHTIVVSAQHAPDVTQEQLQEALRAEVVDVVLRGEHCPVPALPGLRVLLNPTGRFVTGGPQGDCGLTGRKIIVDTYGGMGRHGGGAFSGKDPTKVDRSAAYMARLLALTAVRAGFSRRCEVQLAYAIGVAEPVSLRVDTFGTGVVDDEQLAAGLARAFPLTPSGIADFLDLWTPRYRATARNGHFGAAGAGGKGAPAFPWESSAHVDRLRDAVRRSPR